jgi:response regulator of citrate/malate metabolism
MTTFISILLALCLSCYYVSWRKKRKEKRYWSQKEIDKRFQQEQEKRHEEVMKWYNSVTAQNKNAS